LNHIRVLHVHLFSNNVRLEEAMSRLQLAKIGFLAAAGISFVLSVYLWFSGSKEQGLFVGIWVPSILSLGALMLSGKSNG
jgi:hypothetical protein